MINTLSFFFLSISLQDVEEEMKGQPVGIEEQRGALKSISAGRSLSTPNESAHDI